MLEIRPLEDRDIAALIDLMADWGEPLCVSVDDIRTQVAHCRERVSGELMLAFDAKRSGDRPVGYIQMTEISLVGFEPAAEIAALMVKRVLRSQGIGAALVAAGESWAIKRGLERVVVSSQAHREAAHRFYERLGFTTWKHARFFCKQTAADR